jgi:hypothetical protein
MSTNPYTVDPDAISYPFTPALRAVARRWAKVLTTARKWEFPEDHCIGNVTFGEVRKFWGATGIGERITSPPLPHHRTCGSASGGSVGLSYFPTHNLRY